MVLWHSASSHIYHKATGNALKGAGGVRIYIAVAEVRLITYKDTFNVPYFLPATYLCQSRTAKRVNPPTG